MTKPRQREVPPNVVDYHVPRRLGASPAEIIDLNSMPVTECGCWIWLRSLNHRGYGQMTGFDGGMMAAHRASFVVHRGAIPDGLHVLHTCDVRCCVNPAHLYLGTDKENSRDRISRGRHVKPPRMVGECHPMAKLTDIQVQEIFASSENKSALSRQYSVSRAVIRNIKTGKRSGIQ